VRRNGKVIYKIQVSQLL